VIRVIVQANGETLCDGKFNAIEAICRLEAAADELRRLAAPVFDASWGEQPMPLVAPRAAELSVFINHRS